MRQVKSRLNEVDEEKPHYAESLVGKTISSVRILTDDEINELVWDDPYNASCVLEFTDDTYAVVACDPELNGIGFLDIGKY